MEKYNFLYVTNCMKRLGAITTSLRTSYEQLFNSVHVDNARRKATENFDEIFRSPTEEDAHFNVF